MWFKPKGWKELPEEDKAWMKKTVDLSTAQRLVLCAEENKPGLIRFLLDSYKTRREYRYQAALSAVRHQSAEALQAILDFNKGFDFADGATGDKEAARNLFQSVAPDAISLWKLLYAANGAAKFGQLSELEIIQAIAADAHCDILRFHLDKASSSDSLIFQEFVIRSGRRSPEDLKFVLAWAEKFTGVQPILDGALVTAIESGETGKVQLLLEKKADPNHSNCFSILRAIEKDRPELVGLLLPHVDLDKYGENLMSELKKRNIEPAKIEWLEKSVAAAVSAARIRKNRENYTLVDVDTLSETKQLANGMKLTTLFNFKSGQQTLIVEKSGEKESLAVTVKDFKEIGDEGFIETMRLKFIEMGGKADGITRLPKNSLTRN